MLFRVENLWAHYGSAEALKDINLCVEQGEIVTIIGANGAGKTTFLRTITGLKRATSGKIWFNGKQVDQNSPQSLVKNGMGHVLEGRRLFPHMTVLENLTIGAYLRKNKAEVNKDLENVYEYFPILKEKINQTASTLSGGQQQMVAIARALMARPTLLLMDEPSTGLSPLVVQQIGDIIRTINKTGVSIILVEQNAQLALGLAHRSYVLEVGKIVLEGDARELENDPRVKEAYLGI